MSWGVLYIMYIMHPVLPCHGSEVPSTTSQQRMTWTEENFLVSMWLLAAKPWKHNPGLLVSLWSLFLWSAYHLNQSLAPALCCGSPWTTFSSCVFVISSANRILSGCKIPGILWKPLKRTWKNERVHDFSLRQTLTFKSTFAWGKEFL